MIFYYSGCGNSRMVAREMAAALRERLVFIPEAAKAGEYSYTLEPDEALGFVWPVYCWAPPQLVLDFVAKLRVTGAGASAPSYVWLVTTYGDNAGLTEKVFRKALAAVGLDLSAAIGIQMPETYVNMAGMDVDTPELAVAKIEAARKKLPSVIEMVRARQRVSALEIGGAPWLKTVVVKPLFYKMLVTDRKWTVSSACIGCGKCSKVCPLGNITMEDGHPHWNGGCTTCEACYHVCPMNAIQFGKVTKGKGQYRNLIEI